MRMRLFTLVAVLPFTALAGHGIARGAAEQLVVGTVTSTQVTEGCTSPVGLCTAGQFRGGLRGDFEFTATSIVASADSATTGVVFYTGDLTLHTREGDVYVKDAGAFNSGPGGDVASVSTIVGGTGDLASASGYIRITGIFQGGCVDCDYKGRVQMP